MAIIGYDIQAAIEWLEKGEVVAIPTETVYGLAANIFFPEAIEKVYKVKGRPASNPLIVHVADIEQARRLVRFFPETALKLAKNFWPGPLTIIFDKSELVPVTVTAGQATVAIRVPDHPLLLQLLQSYNKPLAAPSANPFNYISPVTAEQVNRMLGNKIPYILDGGRCKKGIESTIVAIEDEKVKLLRPGAIAAAEIESVLQHNVVEAGKTGLAHPGMFKQHYSPNTPLLLVEEITLNLLKKNSGKIALLLYNKYCSFHDMEKQYLLSFNAQPEEAAWNLYDILHRLDAHGYDLIIAEKMPETGIGKAINDRLTKASQR